MASLGLNGASLSPGQRIAPGFIFGGYAEGLPFYVSEASGESPPPPPPPRTKWPRRVPHPVLIGHAASLTPY